MPFVPNISTLSGEAAVSTPTQDSTLTLANGWTLSFPQHTDTEFVVPGYIAS